MTDIDFESIWTEEFLAEVEKRKEKSEYPPTEWRAGGRASKAWPKKEDSTWWMTNGPDMLATWHKWWVGMLDEGFTLWTTPSGLPAVELAVNVNLGGQFLRGFIDAVLVDPEGELLTIDWKSGAREPEAPAQLGFYKVALEETFKGIEVKWGSYYMSRKGDLGHVYDLSVYTPQLVGDWLRKAAAMQAQGLFIPKPSSLCSACSVKEWCLIMSDDKEKVKEVPTF